MAYVEQTGRRPTLEFALIAGVNDSTEQFNALVGFCRGIHCHINVLALNPTSACGLRPSSDGNIQHFVKALSHYGFETTLRTSRGQSIQGACGQLAGKSTVRDYSI
jgi:23S rRNA (adenine2503-C2)-methyltransferase